MIQICLIQIMIMEVRVVFKSPKTDFLGFGYDPRAPRYPLHPVFPFHPGSFGPRNDQYAPIYPSPGQYGGNQGSQPTYGSRFQPPSATSPPGNIRGKSSFLQLLVNF